MSRAINKVSYSNRLDLRRFFYQVQDQIYVIVKLNDFPNYSEGSDIDIFCYNFEKFAEQVLAFGNCYLEQGFEIIVTLKNPHQTYIDFYYEDNLNFRFDLYKTVPAYQKIHLKPCYFFSVIENAVIRPQEYERKPYPLYVPSPVDELLLRYVEYIEWYELRPDKVKHLSYIEEAISKCPQRISFLDKLHQYTELPEAAYGNASNQISEFGKPMTWLHRVRSKPLSQIPGLAFRKLRKRAGKLRSRANGTPW